MTIKYGTSLIQISDSTVLKLWFFLLQLPNPHLSCLRSYTSRPTHHFSASASLKGHRFNSFPSCSSRLCVSLSTCTYWECDSSTLESVVGLAQLRSVKHGCLRAACAVAAFTLPGSVMDVARACCRFKYFNYVCSRILSERMDMLPVQACLR